MNENDTTLIPDSDTPALAGHERGRTTVPRVIQSVGLTRAFAAGGERGKTRACDADRDRVVEFLNVAYSEGRLSRDEYDDRLDSALSARTYADLDQIVTDLPAARADVVPPASKINGLAIASLACGLAQFVFGPLATIPAIVFGHVARHQIKRTREQGAGLALAGLILGWATVILAVVLILVVGLAMSAGMHGTMH
jgi:type IV secretory pathway VirB2 component (pilin)